MSSFASPGPVSLIHLLDMEWWEVLGVGEEKLGDNIEKIMLDLVTKRI